MAVVIEKPSLLQRVIPFLRGFDWPLITIILFMAAIGLFAMYSLGFDHGARLGPVRQHRLEFGTALKTHAWLSLTHNAVS